MSAATLYPLNASPGFTGDDVFQQVGRIILMFALLVILVYHVATNRIHVANKDKTWDRPQRDESITTTQTAPSTSASKGGGSGGVQVSLFSGRIKLTPNNMSTAYMVLAMGLQIALTITVFEPVASDPEWCEVWQSVAGCSAFLSRPCMYAFMMLRVKVGDNVFTPCQRKATKFLWVWFTAGYLILAIYTLAAVPMSEIVRDEDGDLVCVTQQDLSEAPEVVVMTVAYGFIDLTTQSAALYFFLLPLFKWARANRDRKMSESEMKLMMMVRKVVFWTTMMIASTGVASLVFLTTGVDFLYTVDLVVNAYCLTKQYLRRDESLFVWLLSGCKCDPSDDDVAQRINAGVMTGQASPTSGDEAVSTELA